MQYNQPRFNAPLTDRSRGELAALCDAHGHAMTDRHGKCVRCGDPVSSPPAAQEARA